MKNCILVLLTLLLLGCIESNNKRELIKEIVIDHSETDSAYRWYGITKEIYKIYNCKYEEVSYKEVRTPDINHGITYILNSYGDTVRIICIDYTNYPRREEN